MLEPYAGQLARTVLRGPGRSQDLPGHPTLESNPLWAVDKYRRAAWHPKGSPDVPFTRLDPRQAPVGEYAIASAGQRRVPRKRARVFAKLRVRETHQRGVIASLWHFVLSKAVVKTIRAYGVLPTLPSVSATTSIAEPVPPRRYRLRGQSLWRRLGRLANRFLSAHGAAPRRRPWITARAEPALDHARRRPSLICLLPTANPSSYRTQAMRTLLRGRRMQANLNPKPGTSLLRHGPMGRTEPRKAHCCMRDPEGN